VRENKALHGIRSVSLAIDHLHDRLEVLLSLPESASPVVPRPAAVAGHEEVLGIEQVPVRSRGDLVHYTRFEINEHGARDVMVVVRLVEEHVLPIVYRVVVRGSKVLQHSIWGDAMLSTQLLPELCTNLVAALAALESEDLSWHVGWD